ncbi:MAG TPA: DNA polymerase III subunit chi [Methylotenera sp.]|nr:DNA polymerase III subunit chi [Methylotenera sp.]
MTRIEFFFNVPDKLIKAAELCEKAVAKGRQLTIFSQNKEMNDAMQQQLWLQSVTSFLPSSNSIESKSKLAPIVLDTNGEHLIQDDILINLQSQHPPFFSRFRHLVELVGVDEADKMAARVRFRFYRDRGYEIKTSDMATAQV